VLQQGEVTLATVRAWSADVLWLDARQAEAYESDHYPGALPLNEDEWESLLLPVLEGWLPGTKIVVYCDDQACRASHDVADRLREETGWEDIHVLHGGWALLAGEVAEASSGDTP
tara:strand:- start:399 stop:743 length:345 start_codon:yes stop_codon:yes gene_type:complete